MFRVTNQTNLASRISTVSLLIGPSDQIQDVTWYFLSEQSVSPERPLHIGGGRTRRRMKSSGQVCCVCEPRKWFVNEGSVLPHPILSPERGKLLTARHEH